MKKVVTILLIFLIALSSLSCGAASQSKAIPQIDVDAISTLAPIVVPTMPPVTFDFPAPEDGIESDGLLHVYLMGDGEKVLTPESSFINYIVYYEDNEHLIICMNGKEYVYANVNILVWSGFKSAKSTDEYFDSVISGQAQYWVNDYDGKNGSLIVLDYIE